MLPFSKRGPCLDDETLAGVLRKDLAPAERDRAEDHLASCPACLRALVDLQNPGEEQGDLGSLPGRIKGLARLRPVSADVRPSRSSTRRAAVHRLRRADEPSYAWYAAAAAALLAFAAFVLMSPPADNGSSVARTPSAPRTVHVRETPRPETFVNRPEPAPAPAPRTPDTPPRDFVVTPPPVAPQPETPATAPKIARPPQETAPPAPEPFVRAPTPAPAPIEAPVVSAPHATSAITDRIVLVRIEGNVQINGRPAKSGDAVAAGDVVQTPRGALGRVSAGGALLTLHHETSLSLAAGPHIRLTAGRIFVKSAPGLKVETPAGTVSPIGTEFSVELAGEETTVAVREGKILLQNPKGRVEVPRTRMTRTEAGRAPRAAERVPDPDQYFAWADQAVDPDRSLVLFPGSKRTGLAIAAPHRSPEEAFTDVMAGDLAKRFGVPYVVGTGWTKDSYWVVNAPGKTDEHRDVHAEYVRLLRDAAGRQPARLLVEFHANYRENPSPGVMEVVTSGFPPAELERIRKSWENLIGRHKPATEMRLVFDTLDPTYAVEGRKVEFWSQNLDLLKQEGSLRPGVTARALLLRLPRAVRHEEKLRAQYETILGEWIEGM